MFIQHLNMIITNSCNLDCAHCLLGKKDDSCMSIEVMEATFQQVNGIGYFNICGGEITLVLSLVKEILCSLVRHQIKVGEFSVTINGTIYSSELLNLLNMMQEYPYCIRVGFFISFDQYHSKEIKRLNKLEEFSINLEKYTKNPYFKGFRDSNKLFREGNAEFLDTHYTLPLCPAKTYITYLHQGKFDLQNGICHIGPMVTIDTNGVVTECDASIIHQKTLYNYGNVLEDSIENIYLKNGARVLKPNAFLRATSKSLKNYQKGKF